MENRLETAEGQLGYKIISKKNVLIVRFFEKGSSSTPIKEMSVRKVARLVGSDFDGRKKSTRSLHEATKVVDEYIQMLGGGLVNVMPTVEAFCREYWDWNGKTMTLINKRKKGSVCKLTADNQLANFNRHIVPRLKTGMTIGEVNNRFVCGLQDRLLEETELSKGTINKIIGSLTTPMAKAYRDGKIHNPIMVDALCEDDATSRGIFTAAELCAVERDLMKREEESRLSCDVRLAVFVAAFTGMRMGEIKALTIEQIEEVDDYDSIITIDKAWNIVDKEKEPKGKKSRQVTIPTAIARMLVAHAKENPHKTTRVFWCPMKDKADEVRSSSYFRDNFYKTLENIGISEEQRERRNLCFHSLRHTLSTRLAGKVSSDLAMKTIGHSTKAVHDRYVHADYEMIKPVGDAAREIFSNVLDEMTKA